MKRLLLAAVLTLATALPAMAQTVVIVRHAEKVDSSADPLLSDAGQVRAQALAAQLAGDHLSAILTSPLQRTILTAAPTADLHGMTSEAIPLSDGLQAHLAAIAARVEAAPADAVILIVGHSNTVPLIARTLGYAGAADMPDCEYDRLTTLHLMGEGRAHGVVSRYGEASTCA
ncbi:phosphoglycerate mutase family protein [Brevundimonas basaltis]|uniref:Broad specificity phosphatase PhoE n=1 Tax=Brevundimonas basaltis TaxID=472166 RepID=A0A7W8HYI2_9CAUL|nr:phosphoglycerate mutase family protein [Brevundimonas basaltis]MBB5291272.1 broad specificity phosphatase PhoE [Brevundimonas basaltis]